MQVIFYTLLIYPLESIIEIIYLIAFKILQENAGGAIIVISLCVNLFTLPIYSLAEKRQNKERALQKKLKAKVDDIKAVFTGDECYMILSTYYRQNNYHPLYALRGMLSLLFQIPFFIAAYHFLSELTALQGASFLFLGNLGRPDALLKIGGYSLNFLPIAMTIINCISTAIYTKGFTLKEKIQLYTMAIIFLFLLYNSSSGLVFYWTVNNLFSLIKNIFAKFNYKKKFFHTMYVIGLFIVPVGGIFSIVRTDKKIISVLSAVLIAVYIIIPFFIKLIKYIIAFKFFEEEQTVNRVFYFSIFAAAVLFGLVVPSSLISSSVQEFSYTMQYQNPFYLLWITLLQGAGFMFVWPAILYSLSEQRIKRTFSLLAFSFLILSAINIFIFQGNYGTLTSLLSFTTDEVLKHSLKEAIINLVFLATACIITVLILKSKIAKKLIFLTGLLCISLLTYSIINSIRIYTDYKNVEKLIKIDKKNKSIGHIQKIYGLSKTHKNIIVFMLDRMPGIFIPSIFKDFPDIAKSFDGFTLYPNTISFAGHTYAGAPPLFGGYEYTPEAFGQNTDSNRDMYNESLCVLPRLFSEAGWNTVITDASLANHSWIPDNSIFTPFKGIKALNMEGKYVSEWIQKHNIGIQSHTLPFAETLRNTIRFSFFKAAPLFLRKQLYNKGRYLQSGTSTYGLFDFITKIAPVEFIKKDININHTTNCFNLIVNNVPHTPLALPQAQLFCSKEVLEICKTRCKNEITLNHYISDVYLFKIIANLFDFLKQNNIYDNTRIIFAADHAFGNLILNDSEFDTDFEDKTLQQTYYMPILMIKDFDAKGSLNIDMNFMTNADTPLLTTKDIDNTMPFHAYNPFTGKAFKETINKETFIIANIQEDDTLNIYLKNKNIFDKNNWKKIDR